MYGKIYKWKQEKPKEAVCVPPPAPPTSTHAPEAGRALLLITSRAPQPPPMTPLSPPAPQRGLRLLRRAADATARQRPAPAPHPVREARPGRPADRPQYHAGGLVGSGLHACSSKRAPAGWIGAPEVAERPESLGWPSRVRRRAALLTPGNSWSSTRESTCSCARRHSSPREAWAKGGMCVAGGGYFSFFLGSAQTSPCVLY